MARPAAMVAPDRDTPGISARDWAKPNSTPCFQVRDSSGRMFFAKWSATPITMPNPAIMAVVIHRFRSAWSIASWKSSPRITMGSEPMITSQPIRASGSSRGIFPTRASDQFLMISQMSLRK